MRKGVVYVGMLLKRWRVAAEAAIRATQGVLIAASFEGASLPPVPYARLPYLGRGSGRQNARTDIPPRRPYNDGASLPDRTPQSARRRAVLVRVLAARSRPVIPLGRERTAERGHSLTNLVRCL